MPRPPSSADRCRDRAPLRSYGILATSKNKRWQDATHRSSPRSCRRSRTVFHPDGPVYAGHACCGPRSVMGVGTERGACPRHGVRSGLDLHVRATRPSLYAGLPSGDAGHHAGRQRCNCRWHPVRLLAPVPQWTAWLDAPAAGGSGPMHHARRAIHGSPVAADARCRP